MLTRYRGRGRPSAKDTTRVIHEEQFTVQFQRQEQAINQAEALTGWRIYVTNAPVERLPLPTAVAYYRDQWQLERGFHRFYPKVGYVIDRTVEKWIKDFTYDLHPEREIQVWEEIGAVFDKYNKSHKLTLPQKLEVVNKIIQLVGGERLKDSVSLELIKILKQNHVATFFIRPIKSQQPWDNIDYRMLSKIYNAYIERHHIGILDNTDELIVTLMRLMEGNEPSSELGQELLEIWKNLKKPESNNEQHFDLNNIKDERQKRSREVVTRPGQRKFKSQLMKAYGGCCAITGCSVEAVLQAAHIIPYSGAKTDHPSNGLLLRVDIHQLFDGHYLSISPKTTKVEISSALKNTCYEHLAGQPLRMPKSKTERPNPNALSKHYQIFSSS